MARPKLGEGDTERLHIKISEDELREIEDWRYSNRVPSKSEAVRRLVQIGLRAQRSLPTITQNVADVLDMISEAIDIPEYILAHIDDDKDELKVSKEIAGKLYDAVNFAFNRQIEAQDDLFHLLVELEPLTNNPEFSEALRRANDEARSGVPNEKVLEAIGVSRSIQLKYWRKRSLEILEARLKRKQQEGKDV